MGKRIYDWAAVQAYYDAGHSFRECQRTFGFTHGGWAKACASGRLCVNPSDLRMRRGYRMEPTYDWPAIQTFYDAGNSYRKCCEKFGFCSAAWWKAIKRGDLKTRPREWSVERVLAESKSRWTIKRTLLKAGLLENRCDECGITEWRGRPLSVQIDHRNGICNDHRLENLQMLCPNCHSQTETFAARNLQLKNRSRIV